jgi:hypothetical protein
MRRHPLSRPLCVTLVTCSVTIRFAVALQNVIMNPGKKYPTGRNLHSLERL